MSRTHETLTALKAIPRERLARKLWRTFWAVVIGAGFVIWKVKFEAPGIVLPIGLTFAGVIASGEIVFAPFKLFFNGLLDLYERFMKIKRGGPPEAAG